MMLSRGGGCRCRCRGASAVPSIILFVQYALDTVEVGGCGALRPAVRTTLQDHMQLSGVMWVTVRERQCEIFSNRRQVS